MATPEKQINQVIRVGNTLTNLIDKQTKQIFTADKVTTYYDGTPMTDAKVDGYVYRKAGSEYFLKNLGKYEELFLEKDTVAQLRDLSATEVLLLKMKFYKGVTLNGYYNPNDTPAPIQYYLSDTTESEDGGSIFEVGGIKLEHEFVDELNVLYFGVIGDNVYDNAPNLSNVESYLNKSTLRFRLIFPAKAAGFYSSQPFTVRRLVSVLMYSPFYTDSPTYGIKIGQADVDNFVDLKLSVVRKTQSNWIDDTIGIILTNLNQSTNIEIVNANNFNIGLQIEGDGGGSCYNKIMLGTLANNKINILLTQRRNGWVNENLYFGGRFRRFTSINNNNDIYGIVFDSEDSTYENFNNNNFYEPSFEFRGDTFTDMTKEIIPIWLKQGQMNKFIDCRNETNTHGKNATVFIRTEGNAQKNYVEIGYTANNSTYQDLGLYPSTNLKTRHESTRLDDRELVVSYPFIRNNFLGYGGVNARVLDSALYMGQSGNTSRSKTTTITLYEDSILLPATRGVMIRLTTLTSKRFVVQTTLHKDTLQGYRINIRCYNSDNVLLSNADGAMVTGVAERIPSFSPDTFGGTWRTGSNSGSGTMYFNVANQVAYIDVIIAGGTGTGGTRLSGFSIYCLDRGLTPAIISTPEITPYNAVIPTDTSFPVGTFIKDLTGVNFGWEYKTIADVDQWVAVPNPAEIVNATTTVKGLVNQSTAVSDVTTPDATDDIEAISLVNELKAKINAMLASDRASEQRAT